MFFVKHIINYLKRYYKIDRGPEFLEALHRINRPSEVTVPNELIPAGVLMQLRGLLNLHVLSINSDWVWPYWMEQQFNPKSESFIPRAMSLTYINLTHRNWTAVGVLSSTRESVVDPRGAVMPWFNGWSLDTWLKLGNQVWFPSRMPAGQVNQRLEQNLPVVVTEWEAGSIHVELRTWAFAEDGVDYTVQEARVTAAARSPAQGKVILSLRPSNPEGISLINNVAYNTKGFWNVEGNVAVHFASKPARSLASTHESGDVARQLDSNRDDTNVHCPVGLATAASVFPFKLEAGESTSIFAVMPMEPLNPRLFPMNRFTPEFLSNAYERTLEKWRAKLQQGTSIELPDKRYQASFDANKAFLVLLNDEHEITAGPLTYHRHWFRDAAFLLNGLDKMGFGEDAARNLKYFPLKQWKNGYFCSQKGEWDSNGEAIWAIVEHYRLSGDIATLRELYPAIKRGVLWIEKKRNDISFSPKKPKGLLPAGFSAEHLGPNDYYYWDNFWSLKGVRDAIIAAEALQHADDKKLFEQIHRNYLRDLETAMNRDIEFSDAHVLPAAPYRRPDAGMIGNVAAAYPLKLFRVDETPWLQNTIQFIRDHLFHEEGFYQQMIHSGINSYLTMQMAQCMLFTGDIGAYKLIEYMLNLATPTWCWPEAIHPRTRGGCMGDGHHGWAAAEWLLLLRNMVVHEHGDVLQITRLLPAEWCKPKERVSILNAPTYFGLVAAAVEFGEKTETLTIHAQWREAPREIHWFLPAEGRRLVQPQEGVRLEGAVAILHPSVSRVVLEVDLAHAHSIAEGAIPGLEELEKTTDSPSNG